MSIPNLCNILEQCLGRDTDKQIQTKITSLESISPAYPKPTYRFDSISPRRLGGQTFLSASLKSQTRMSGLLEPGKNVRPPIVAKNLEMRYDGYATIEEFRFFER